MASSRDEIESILSEFKLSPMYRNKLSEIISWSYEIGWDSPGLGIQIDWNTIDENVVKWIDERAIESEVFQQQYVKDKLTGYLQSYVKDGKTMGDFRTDINDLLDNAGIGENKRHHVDTIFHNETTTALNYGRFSLHQEIKDVAPMWELAYIDDGNHQPGTVCYDVAERGGFRAMADDPIWKRIHPPNHHRCRSSVIAIPKTLIKEKGIRPSRYEVRNEIDGFDKPVWKW
jgi:hypothetical protein